MIDIKAIRASIHPDCYGFTEMNTEDAIALCDEVERLRKDAARLDHVLKWDDGCWTSREQIDKSIADDAAMEAKQ